MPRQKDLIVMPQCDDALVMPQRRKTFVMPRHRKMLVKKVLWIHDFQKARLACKLSFLKLRQSIAH
jgi:hypothetical protein